jgi:hypothetical protein
MTEAVSSEPRIERYSRTALVGLAVVVGVLLPVTFGVGLVATEVSEPDASCVAVGLVAALLPPLVWLTGTLRMRHRGMPVSQAVRKALPAAVGVGLLALIALYALVPPI